MGLCGVVLWSLSVATSRALVLGLLALLCCLPTHPQQHFCRSAVVIRAKVTSEKIVTFLPVNIQIILTDQILCFGVCFRVFFFFFAIVFQMFKGVEKVKEVRYVYTSVNTSLCGTRIAVNSKRHTVLMLYSLLSPHEGNVLNDGKIFINMCNYIQPWENVSMAQRQSLNHHYLFNCDCEVRGKCCKWRFLLGEGIGG
uniref:Metalloproteinase inhibitor 4 n=1 Tax=Marmota marmota marmota TaxID=9994 RepID=A0A8C5ZAY0_MARMA